MEFLNVNETVQSAIRIAKGVAREYGNGCYAPSHLLFALMHREIGLHSFVEALGKDVVYIREWAEVRIEEYPKEAITKDISAHGQLKELFEQADNIRLKWGLLEVNPLCVLAAIATPQAAFSVDELRSFPIREREIHDLFLSGVGAPQKSKSGGSTEINASDYDPLWSAARGNLEKYCTDKTASAVDKKVFPIVCRDSETRMMMEILGRLGKPNVLIIGDAGVGKTALVDGLACRIAEGAVPQYLKEMSVYELDTGTLIAGATYKGEIEERLKGILKELESEGNAILFIDEIHTLIDPKSGNSGAASILKPELAKGKITVIGATTVDEYRKLIEPDHAFSRRFEVLQVSEPDATATVNMIESVLDRYTEYHGVGVEVSSLGECVALAKRYVKERRLPDAAIDLIDRTMSAVKMINQSGSEEIQELSAQLAEIEASEELPQAERAEKLRLLSFSMNNRLSPILLGLLSEDENVVEPSTYSQWIDYLVERLAKLQAFTKSKIEKITAHEVASVISASTGIPIGKIESGEKEKLLGMEDTLRRRVVGQDGALKVLTDAIVESRSGMNKVGQPIGSFFLLGPTGTGKTELAKALAESLFNDEKAMIRFDMSEFKEEHSAALLYGAPPGYVGYEEGGLLVNKIRRQPYAVVLFDEIEKAHSSVYDIFLQIMDEGKLHDRLGKEGDFSNSIVLFTSNVGSEWLAKQISEGKTPTTTDLMDVMGSYFRPEFLARLSEIVPFSPINEDMLIRIFDIQMKSVVALLDKQGIAIEISDDARRTLAHRGFTPKYGARQVAGTIRNYIRRPISKMIIGGELTAGNIVCVDQDASGEITWNVK